MIFHYNNLVQILQMLQCRPIYPSIQPRGHILVIWSQASLFIQFPLHRPLHFNPKYPELHSTLTKVKLFNDIHIEIIPYFSFACLFALLKWFEIGVKIFLST